MLTGDVVLNVPEWLAAYLGTKPNRSGTTESRMAWVIELARLNVERETGGPFGAAVFDQGSGRLLSAGVNCVVRSGCSVAHAEIMAIAAAQIAVGTYDLGGAGLPGCELVTSTEPCAMCLGAICWSGVRRVVCGARDEDARSVGFDEGPKVVDWVGALEQRGIAVERDVLREEAAAVLRHYEAKGGTIYNARQAPG